MPLSRLRLAIPFVLAALAPCERARPVFVPKVVAVPDTNPIWIGEFGSWSGHDAREGLAEHRGIQLAIETLNTAGGVRGRKVRVHGYDDQSNAKSAGMAGLRLAQQDKAVLIVGGTTSGRATAAAIQAGGVPLVSPAFISPATGEHAWFAVAIDPDVSVRISALAEHAHAAGLDRVTVLVRPEVAGDRVNAKAFTAAAKDRGIDRVEQATLAVESLDETIAALKSDAPSAVFVACSGADAAAACSVLKRRGVACVLFAAGAPDVESLPLDQRDALEGVVAVSLFDPDARTGPSADLIAAHGKRFDEAPDEHEFLGWLAGRRAVAALTRATEYWAHDVTAAVIATDGPLPPFVIVRVQHGVLHTIRSAKGDT
jgi:branched-chain amino acid transport system substrate-binding protein